jgi:hypothetical protein
MDHYPAVRLFCRTVILQKAESGGMRIGGVKALPKLFHQLVWLFCQASYSILKLKV